VSGCGVTGVAAGAGAFAEVVAEPSSTDVTGDGELDRPQFISGVVGLGRADG